MDIDSSAIRRAVGLIGSQAKVGGILNRTQSAVGQWCKGLRPVPAELVLLIYRACGGGVTPHDLRPDLYPDPNYRPPLPSPESPTHPHSAPLRAEAA